MPTSYMPSFPLFAADFMTDVSEWSNAEKGAHITLMCYQWIEGSIPSDAGRIRRILGCTPEEFSEIWPVVKNKYVTDKNGRLYNKRLELTRSDKVDFKKKLSVAGLKGADVRWKKSKKEK